MDAMVTGCMSAAKKELDSQVLRELGTSASQAINKPCDCVIFHRALPFASEGKSRRERLHDAVVAVDAVPKIDLDARYAAMDLIHVNGRATLRRWPSRGRAMIRNAG